MQGVERVILAPFDFLVSGPFKLGFGDEERSRTAAGERINHTRRFVEICHPLPFSKWALALCGQAHHEKGEQTIAPHLQTCNQCMTRIN
jgi:hypothetical protein